MLTDQFLIALKKQYLDTIARYNPGTPFETRQWDFTTGAGKAETNVSRGKVFEKACVSTISATVVIPGRDYQSSIQWLGIQTFPANPLVPLFMGVFEHVSEKGTEHCPGYFDVYPTIPFDEDGALVRKEMEVIARKHNRNYEDLVKGYQKMFEVQDTLTGIGYRAGIAFGPEESDFTYFQDAARAIAKTYFLLVERRNDMKPTPDQTDIMFKQRAEWVRFTFMENRFFKGGITLGVPPECFMLHMLPPLVKF